jgi:bacteriocin biosynthesis cyclodehydratase domain-containing protein
MTRTASPIHLLLVGTFAKAVSDYIKTIRTDTYETVVTDDNALDLGPCSTARVNVVVAWHPVSRLCEKIDKVSRSAERPFIPVILDSINLRLGPVLIPGTATCWSCWERRSLQRSRHPDVERVLWKFYESHTGVGPKGYLEPFALMAAARLMSFIEQLDRSVALPGYIWQINMLTREVLTGTLVGVDDCPNCGLHRPPEKRGYDQMQQDLQFLWS